MPKVVARSAQRRLRAGVPYFWRKGGLGLPPDGGLVRRSRLFWTLRGVLWVGSSLTMPFGRPVVRMLYFDPAIGRSPGVGRSRESVPLSLPVSRHAEPATPRGCGRVAQQGFLPASRTMEDRRTGPVLGKALFLRLTLRVLLPRQFRHVMGPPAGVAVTDVTMPSFRTSAGPPARDSRPGRRRGSSSRTSGWPPGPSGFRRGGLRASSGC